MSSARSVLKQTIQSSFKLRGFQLRVDACRYLEELLAALDDSEWSEWIDKILELLEAKDLEAAVVDKTLISKIVKECSDAEAGDNKESHFNVIDAFSVPRLTYCNDRRKFLPDKVAKVPEPLLYPGAARKAEIFSARHRAIQQRCLRHKLFTPAIVAGGAFSGSSEGEKKYRLKTVDFLLGTTSKLDEVIVLGMLAQIKHGKYSLEDPSGVVDIDLSEAKFHHGLFTENCFVLVEGWYEDLVFHVTAVGHPPPESSETTRAFFGNVNFFGGPSEVSLKCSRELLALEQNDDDNAMLVFLSDVWLDKAKAMEKLHRLFAGYSTVPPKAFVFMGNFMSAVPQGGASNHAKMLKDHFKQLGDLLTEFPDLVKESKFIFVGGSLDPGSPNIFPRPPLPGFITGDFRKQVPSAIFTTNPARLQYCTQEIVLFREDIVSKMCRNCIYFPEKGDIPGHFARTVVSQGHLAPLPLHICPVYWDFDRSMWIYPVPDLVVVGDKFDPFTSEHSDCTIINPGSFVKNEFSFKTYLLKSRQVEDSQIPDDDS